MMKHGASERDFIPETKTKTPVVSESLQPKNNAFNHTVMKKRVFDNRNDIKLNVEMDAQLLQKISTKFINKSLFKV